jgi:hypothetical protein
MITIRLVTDRVELEEVFRLRYRVIVQEMGDPAPADARGMVEDPADATGLTLAAFSPDNRVLAAVRFNVVSEGLYHPCADILAAAGVKVTEPAATALTARLVSEPSVRTSPVPIRLVCEGYRHFLGHGIRRNLIYVRLRHEQFYHRLGYFTVGEAVHPSAGPQKVLDFDLTADTQLRRLALRGVTS